MAEVIGGPREGPPGTRADPGGCGVVCRRGGPRRLGERAGTGTRRGGACSGPLSKPEGHPPEPRAADAIERRAFPRPMTGLSPLGVSVGSRSTVGRRPGRPSRECKAAAAPCQALPRAPAPRCLPGKAPRPNSRRRACVLIYATLASLSSAILTGRGFCLIIISA